MATATFVLGPVTSGKTEYARRSATAAHADLIEVDAIEKLHTAGIKFSDKGATPEWLAQRSEVYRILTDRILELTDTDGTDVYVSGAWPNEAGFGHMLQVIDRNPATSVEFVELPAPTEEAALARWVERGAKPAAFAGMLRHAGGWQAHVRASRLPSRLRREYPVVVPFADPRLARGK